MDSRLRFLVPATLIATLCFASTSVGLEKTVARFDGGHRDGWNRATTVCTVAYYNYCTGWIWIWSGWSPGDRFGVTFQPCCSGGGSAQLTETFIFFWSGSPSGYGFTGTLDVWNADANGCPSGTALYSQAYLPVSGWNQITFATPIDVSAGDFVISYTLAAATLADPMAITSDHPAAGPTGPAACGTCFPTSRAVRTYYYGTAATPTCPGSLLSDGVCDVEFLWDASLNCGVAVEQVSWGGIKQLYR